jgi:hypothetical protein
MSVDCSRFSFDPWKDLFGVIMQQGRVQLDSDWNEWVAQVARRLQVGTLDTLGEKPGVPRTTPDGFRILINENGELLIGPGRIYVDGLLAENHGAEPPTWDTRLAESRGSADVPFYAQPYLPFNDNDETGDAAVFNRPKLADGRRLAYLDVWQREVTYLQQPELVEKAVGVDTTARLQTVWQVKLLDEPIGNADCHTPDGEVPGWAAATRSSGAWLTNSRGHLPENPDPCLPPPEADYRGLENQLYRVEIHHGGPQAEATFKWSRENGSVGARVTEIHGGNRLVVDSIGRDEEALGFRPGDWIEILDDWHELHGLPGRLHRIQTGKDGVSAATRSISLAAPLPAELFPVDAQGRPVRPNTRIRRWDQSEIVYRADGTPFLDLREETTSVGIPVPDAGAGISLALEHGILIELGLADGGEFKTGDYWVFYARSIDGKFESLNRARPRGIHHHYARLAVIELTGFNVDCRVFWPPEVAGGGCDCTVCVSADGHNTGTATIQQAIDAILTRGGTVCLGAGSYQLDAPLKLVGARSVRIRGQGWLTLLQVTEPDAAIEISQGVGVTIENLAVLGAAGGNARTLIGATNCVDLRIERLAAVAVDGITAVNIQGTDADADAGATALALSGPMLGTTIRDCTFVAAQGVAASGTRSDYLLTANLRLIDNLFLCRNRGVSLAGMSMHHGELRLSGNLMLGCSQAGIVATGGALPAANVTIAGNLIQVSGSGILAGTDNLSIADNQILGVSGQDSVDGIVLTRGLDWGPIEDARIAGNRIAGFSGHAIAIRHALGQATIEGNLIDGVRGGGLVMEEDASAAYLRIEDNRFVNLGIGLNDDRSGVYVGLLLQRAARADVLANLFAGVARDATESLWRVALGAVASEELRIAGNRMHDIGPPKFAGTTAALAIDNHFRRLAVDDNSIARIGDAAQTHNPSMWQAITILGNAGDTRAPVPFYPGVTMFDSQREQVYLSAFRVDTFPRALSSVSLRSNHLHAERTDVPLVEVDGVSQCRFDQNDVLLADNAEREGQMLTASQIRCGYASVAHNSLIGFANSVSIDIDADKFTVLGNLTSGAIKVKGADLPPPWDSLNVITTV